MATLVLGTVLLNSHSGGRAARVGIIKSSYLTGHGPGLSAIVDVLRETIERDPPEAAMMDKNGGQD